MSVVPDGRPYPRRAHRAHPLRVGYRMAEQAQDRKPALTFDGRLVPMTGLGRP